MVPKRMKHERHGFTHAFDHQEVEVLRASGWTEDEPEVVKPEVGSDLKKLKK